MNKKKLSSLLYFMTLVVAIVASTFHVIAQETDEEAPIAVEVLTTGEVVPLLDEQFDDWRTVCIEDPDGSTQCSMSQDVIGADGSRVAKVEVFSVTGVPLLSAGAVILTPLGTNLEEAIALRIDSKAPKRYRFKYCVQEGCVAKIGLLTTEVDDMKRGQNLQMTLFALEQLDNPLTYVISLKGFTRAFDALDFTE